MSSAEKRSQDHFPHALATTMKSIFRRICPNGRDAQLSLISHDEKERGVFFLAPRYLCEMLTCVVQNHML